MVSPWLKLSNKQRYDLLCEDSLRSRTEKIEEIVRAGQLAPSAMGVFPWEIVVTQDREKMDRVTEVSPYTKFAKDAGAVFVVLMILLRAEMKINIAATVAFVFGLFAMIFAYGRSLT